MRDLNKELAVILWDITGNGAKQESTATKEFYRSNCPKTPRNGSKCFSGAHVSAATECEQPTHAS
eukprot:5420419-Pleurochrysis_carterae.AAC.2